MSFSFQTLSILLPVDYVNMIYIPPSIQGCLFYTLRSIKALMHINTSALLFSIFTPVISLHALRPAGGRAYSTHVHSSTHANVMKSA